MGIRYPNTISGYTLMVFQNHRYKEGKHENDEALEVVNHTTMADNFSTRQLNYMVPTYITFETHQKLFIYLITDAYSAGASKVFPLLIRLFTGIACVHLAERPSKLFCFCLGPRQWYIIQLLHVPQFCWVLRTRALNYEWTESRKTFTALSYAKFKTIRHRWVVWQPYR